MSGTLFDLTPLRAAPSFRPLLKWPGGKAREWEDIAPALPRTVRHFVDPFLGGGAPFARTPFDGRAWLNDRHERLVDLHVRAQRGDPGFLEEVRALGEAWERLGDAVDTTAGRFAALVDAARERQMIDVAAACAEIASAVASAGVPEAAAECAASVLDKAKRLANLERRHAVSFGAEEIAGHGETAVRAGFYTFVRSRESAAKGTSARATADFLFVREFCYGSMFRHNAEGGFNIPYGGRSYNRKRFLDRWDQLRSEGTRAALARATFSCGDFEPFLDGLRSRLGPGDLVFADPPYDSDFRSYGPDAFGPADHERLAASLARLPCPWLLVIKETDFVRATYLSPASRAAGARELHVFDKEYGYNVRGRNRRATRHVLISNYDPPRTR